MTISPDPKSLEQAKAVEVPLGDWIIDDWFFGLRLEPSEVPEPEADDSEGEQG